MRVLITGANGQLGGALQRTAPGWADINAIDVDDVDLTDHAMLTARLAVEAPDVIVNAANDANCDNGQFCDGAETCNAITDCQAGTPPATGDGVGCTDDSCDEILDVIVSSKGIEAATRASN